MKPKYYLALTTKEWRLMIECLNKLRNRLISEDRYTDVDRSPANRQTKSSLSQNSGELHGLAPDLKRSEAVF